MAGLVATIDPDGAPLALTAANGFDPLSIRLPVPDAEVQWASSAATEGELSAGSRDTNRAIPMRLRITGRGRTEEAILSTFAAAQRALDEKISKLRREGGVLRLEFPGFDTIDFLVQQVSGGDRLFDNRFMRLGRTEDEITFECLPYGVGDEVEVPVVLERSTPCLITQPFEVGGDVEALGRLVLTDQSGRDVLWLRWGRESRNLSADPTAALYYPAASLTPLGSAAVDGTAITQRTLAPGWLAMLTTRIAGVGPMTHVGVFEVRARIGMPTSNTGEVQLRFEYWTGDGTSRMENATLAFIADHSREGQQIQVSLGEVYLAPGANGAHQWTGQILAKSTALGDDLSIADLTLVPLTEGNGTLAAVPQSPASSSVLAADAFDHAAGALDGATAPIGGRWVGASGPSVTGAVQVGSGTAYRTATRDLINGLVYLGRGRYGILSTATTAETDVSARVTLGAPATVGGQVSWVAAGLVGRYTDVDNCLTAQVVNYWSGAEYQHTFAMILWVAGAPTGLAASDWRPGLFQGTHTFRLVVGAHGWAGLDVDGARILTGYHASLLTGGGLARGAIGVHNHTYMAAGSATVYFDSFFAAQGSTQAATNAAVFANRQVELSHDRAERESAAGGTWGRVPDIGGDYLKLAPAGAEERRNRIIAIPSVSNPETGPDPGTGRLSARLFIRPRYRVVPIAA